MKLLALLPVLVFLSGATAIPHPDVLEERVVVTKTKTKTKAGSSSPTSAPKPPGPITVTQSGDLSISYPGTYQITCIGGSGGDAGTQYNGGLAGVASAQFVLKPSITYHVVIGQAGSDGSNRKTPVGSGGAGGGGGASSITAKSGGTTFLLLVAAGGGGAGSGGNGNANNGASTNQDGYAGPGSGNDSGGSGGGFDMSDRTAQNPNLGQGANGSPVTADMAATGYPGNGGAGGGGGGGAGATAGGGGGGGFYGGNGGGSYTGGGAGFSYIPDCSSAGNNQYTDYLALAARSSATYYGANSAGNGYCTISYQSSSTTTCVGV